MPKSWEERYGGLRKAKQEQSQTPPQTDRQNENESRLQAFNNYLKSLNLSVPCDKKELKELFYAHGKDAWNIYTQKHPEALAKPSRNVLHIIEPEPLPDPQKKDKQQTTDDSSKPVEKTDNNNENNWLSGYEKSFNKWVKNNTFKQTGEPKRTITINKTEETLDIDITPVNPSPRRNDQGASYHFADSPEKEDTIDVTVTNKNAEKPLNYDYIYALVKSAKDNGIDTIEFKDVKTPEFANMLMVASLQFDMKMQNQPEFMIDNQAPYIPNKLQEKIEQYNSDKKPLPARIYNEDKKNEQHRSSPKNNQTTSRPQRER